MQHILKCQKCSEYTMKENCKCGGTAITTKPPRYSPGKYAQYRKEAKRQMLTEKGLL